MTHILGKYQVYIIAILSVCILLVGKLLLTETVNLSDLKTKQGKVENAVCVDYKATSGVKFLVNYFGENEQDFIILPKNINCHDILPRFIGSDIKITYYQNSYFGILLDNKSLTDTDTELSEFNNKNSSIAFIMFVSVFSALLFYFKGRHVTNRSRNGTREKRRAP